LVEQFGLQRDHLEQLVEISLVLAETSTSTTSPPND
jgi:hypothetical protein